MVDESRHISCVKRWFDEAADGVAREEFLAIFEQAFAAVWRRAHVTLGDVTLSAILDRVIYSASERSPVLASLTVNEGGIHCRGLADRELCLEEGQVEQALQALLVEFLTILGNLTADVLTPALHVELAKVGRQQAARRAERAKS